MTDVANNVAAEDAESVLTQLVTWQRGGDKAALIVLTGIEGGAVRAPGALMAVNQNGNFAGYMSGGCIDADLVLQSQAAIQSGTSKQIRYGAGSPFVDLPLPCGGALILNIVPNPDADVLVDALAKLEARESASFRLSSSGKLSVEPPTRSGRAANGDFFALLQPKPRLRIAGRGADCLALARIAEATGWQVRVQLTDRKDVPAAEAAGLSQIELLETPGQLPDLVDDDGTAFVLMAHDRDWEVPLLYQAVTGPAFFIGAVGSVRTQASRREALAEAGLESSELNRIRGPVGLVPSMRDASMLAVSVLAEIVEAYHLPAQRPLAKTAALMLAAGQSTRFGSDKLMADLAGSPVLAHADSVLHQSVVGARLAVTNPERPERAALLKARGWHTIDNPSAEQGQESSLALGVESFAAQTELESLLILLGDMPRVPTRHLVALAEALTPGTDAVFSEVDGVPCPPVLFARSALPELAKLSGDAGARALYHSLPNVRSIPLNAEHGFDIDSPDDLQRAGDLSHA